MSRLALLLSLLAGSALAASPLAASPLAASPVDAGVERYAVLLGNNHGAVGEQPLRYAEEDARRVHDVMADLGGFRPENLLLLRGEDAATARRALIALNERIRHAASARGTQAMLLVYYSGHADAQALHLGDSALALEELEGLVRGSAATFRLLVLDACRSGALTRVKGGSPAPALQLRLEERLPGEGAVFLTSSSANEDAQESDALQGSFFTHYLVSGLMGAADEDADGQVVLEEAYRHAYTHTLRASSATLTGPQHPTFQYELRGQGDVVLSRLGGRAERRGQLEFPPERTYLVFDESERARGAVVAEVAAHDARRRLSLRAGRYLVRGRGRDFLLEGQVEVRPAQQQRVTDAQLTRTEYARLVRKGRGEPGALPGQRSLAHSPQLGARVRTAFWRDSSPCLGGFVGWGLELAQLSITPRVGYCSGSIRARSFSTRMSETDLGLRLTRAWDFSALTLDAGVVVGGALLQQDVLRVDGPWAVPLPSRRAAAGLVGATVGLTRDLPGALFVTLDVESQTYFFRRSEPAVLGEPGILPTQTRSSFALRSGLAFGRRW